MATRVAINGFGRIGRLVARHLKARSADFDLVAVNDLTDARTLAYLFKNDSVHGTYPGEVSVDGTDLVIGGDRMKVLAERDPAALPWGELGVDYVIESTGLFRTGEAAGKHVSAGAKKVIISAPGKGGVDATFVMGVNHEDYDPANHHVVSNASCTTNCLAPVAKVIDEHCGIANGWMTTIHAYTNDQRILDVQHSDLRRARAAAINTIPTSTGAAKAISLVYPKLEGKLHGGAMRVPVADGSCIDMSFNTERPTTAEAINEALRAAAAGPLAGILRAADEPLVSSDIIGTSHSSIADLGLTSQMSDTFFRIVSWYDNENAYSVRCVDLVAYMVARDAG